MTAPVTTAAPPRRALSAPAWPVGLRAVIARRLRDERRAVLLWGAALGALGAFMAAIYPSIRGVIEQVVDQYPAGLKQAFGVTDMTTVEGYVHAEMFSLIAPLAVGTFAIRSTMRPTIGAEERGELDTVLSLPLSRFVLATASFAATAIAAAGVLALTGALTWISGRIAGTGISAGLTAAGTLGLWPFALFFAGVTMLAVGAVPRSAIVTGGAAALLVGMYALDLAARLVTSLGPLRFASAFHYYGAPLRDGLDLSRCAVLAVAGVVLAIAGGMLFGRRDVRQR